MSGRPDTALGTVLGVWAHPDDEAYLMAGTALRALQNGCVVACLTATAGEAGVSADEGRWPRRELSAIRRAELSASLAAIGVADHACLDLPDGGLSTVDQTRAVDRVAAVVDRIQPDTVLTFGSDGITGHPDHVTVGGWALTAARSVLGDRCRVLAATKTPEWLARFASLNEGILADPPPCTPPERLALHVELSEAEVDAKLRALLAQPSQTSGLIDAMGEDTYRTWLAEESWVESR